MTTALERLVATAAGRSTDRAPVFCNLLEQGARELGVSIREYYARGDLVAEAQLRMRARYDYDNVWSLFYVSKEAELLGAPPDAIVYADDGPPNLARHPLASLADVDRLVVPDPATHPAMAEPLRCLRALRREVGGRHPICAYVTASTTLPALALGMEAWMALLLEGPASVRDELLSKCSELTRREIALYASEGADVILYSSPFGSTDVLPLPLVDELVLPWIERDLAGEGADRAVYYAGSARIADVVPAVRARVGATSVYPGPDEDAAALRAAAGPDALCAGVVNDIRLIDGTPEDARAEVRRIFDAGAGRGPFLFGTVLMPLAIPEENVHALVDEARACASGRGRGAT
jgi:uroporphyrinogen decarboxylase